jgi:hypothetical protein
LLDCRAAVTTLRVVVVAAEVVPAVDAFETGDERYKWLNAVQAIGQGRYENGRLIYHMFEVR